MGLFVAGLDLGQSKDYTALAVVEVIPTQHEVTYVGREAEMGLPIDRTEIIEGPPASLAFVGLERVELGTPYPAIVTHVSERLRAIPGQGLLAVDRTGVGTAVVDMFYAAGLQPLAVTITGGDTVRGE